MTRIALSLVLLCALGGCAENAVLEVELTLPPQPAMPEPQLFAYVQARSADVVSFDETWAGTDAVEGRELMAEESTLAFSIVAGGASITRQVGIRVRFCETPDCTGLGDDHAPELRYRLQRAFYLGRRTRWTPMPITTLPPIPPMTGAPVIDVDKCDIEGCTVGATTDYCYTSTGRHFCEE